MVSAITSKFNSVCREAEKGFSELANRISNLSEEHFQTYFKFSIGMPIIAGAFSIRFGHPGLAVTCFLAAGVIAYFNFALMGYKYQR